MNSRLHFSDLKPEVKVATLFALITGLNESGKLPDAILSAALSRHGITPEVIAEELENLGHENTPEFLQFEQFFSDANLCPVDWLGANECLWVEPKSAVDYIAGQQTLVFEMRAIAQVLPFHCPVENKEAWVILIPDAIYGMQPTLLRDSPIYRNRDHAISAVMEIVYAQFNRDHKPQREAA